jgi:hypothetical protein
MNYKEPTQEQRAKILIASNEKEALCQEKERR